MRSKILTLRRSLLDLFYPRTCVHTGELLNPNTTYRYISPEALKSLEWINGFKKCITCGIPFEGEIVENKHCINCQNLDPLFTQGLTVFYMRGLGKSLIHEIKYRGGLYLKNDISKLLSTREDVLLFIENSILVPVPLHPRRLKSRGFNQSLVFARCLAEHTQNCKISELLDREKITKSQTTLSRKERTENVKNAFALSEKFVINGSLNYILVDDVFTTGATLNACAKVLKANGAKSIRIITLGHG